MTVLFATLVILYVLLIGSFIHGFSEIPYFLIKEHKTKTHFSIIIPFRNEEKHLAQLIDSILKLDYKLAQFEVLFVNDASTDNSEAILKAKLLNTTINYRLLKNIRQSNSPKKDAITTAIAKAKNPWIVTTDADCLLPEPWLKTISTFIQEVNPKMIVAPVTYRSNNSFVHNFQTLDFWSLQTVTIGAFGIKKPFLCNGANLAFTKSIFNILEGYKDNNAIASGDDIFLMEKLLKIAPEDLKYLKSKDATVTTYPEPSWTRLCHQRLRWASKTSGYRQLFPKLVGLMVLIANGSLIIMTLLCMFGLFNIYLYAILGFLKINIDYWAIYKTAKFHNTRKPLKHYFISSLLYPLFSGGIAMSAMLFNYKWKGRHFNK